MSEDSVFEYKGLTLLVNREFNYLEVVIDEKNFSNQEKYISSVSRMLEFALDIHPRFIIINREKHKFTITSKLFPFTSNNIINPLKIDNVKKIICIGTEEEYQIRYKEIEELEPFIKWVNSKQAAIEWIKQTEQENSNT